MQINQFALLDFPLDIISPLSGLIALEMPQTWGDTGVDETSTLQVTVLLQFTKITCNETQNSCD